MTLTTPLIGLFNASNIWRLRFSAIPPTYPPEVIGKGIESLPGVPGRLERVASDMPINVFVDYAHTPDALKKTIETLNHVRSGRLIVVFGCGGDRDRTKRPVMGRIVSQLADVAVITSDNPRSEDPLAIHGGDPVRDDRQRFQGHREQEKRHSGGPRHGAGEPM